MKNAKSLSLASRNLRYKLRISFYLTSVLPLLVCIYLISTYLLPKVGLKLDIGASILISAFIATAGFFIIKEVFDRIVNVCDEAKLIAAGDTNRVLEVGNKDEIGVLSDSLNQLTQRIRSNMDELKSYSEKTTEINVEIQKRVLVLSSLLQISSLISQSAKLEDILKLTVEKARLLANSDLAFLFYREESQVDFCVKASDGVNAEQMQKICIQPQEDLFLRILSVNKPLIVDNKNKLSKDLAEEFSNKMKLKNAIITPVYLRGRVTAALGIGNMKEEFVYRKDDLELVDIFTKQAAIAIENDILMHRLEKLEIKDPLTGLYNGEFIRNRLQEEIKRAIAYQRPCAFILLDIDNFKAFNQNYGSIQAEAALKQIASLIKDTVSEIDRVGRIGDDEFAVVLPEKNKRKAHDIAEEMRKKIQFSFSEEADEKKKITLSGGVSENPLDGIESEELIKRAKELVKIAKERGKNRIVAFDKEPKACQ